MFVYIKSQRKMAKKITIKQLKQKFQQNGSTAKARKLFTKFQNNKGKMSKMTYGKEFRLGNIDKYTKHFYVDFLNYYDLIGKLQKAVQSKGRLLQLDPPITHSMSQATETSYRCSKDIDMRELAKLIREKFIDPGLNQAKFGNDEKFASTKVASKENLSEDVIEEVIKKLAQSFYAVTSTDFIITIVTIPIAKGGSCDKLCPFLKDRSGFVQIKNDDNLCGQRCLVLSEIDYNNRARYISGKRSMDAKLNKMCKGTLGINGYMSFIDFEHYKKKRVCIIGKGLKVLYETEVESEKKMYLFYDDENEHYHLITCMSSFVDKDWHYKWCDKCNNKFEYGIQFNTHKCNIETCCHCKSTDLCKNRPRQWAQCKCCNRWCFDQQCLEQHQAAMKTKNTPLCTGKEWKCQQCKKWVDKERYFSNQHICGEYQCSNCKEFVTEGHRCYIQKIDKIPKPVDNAWSYDFESKIGDDGLHTVMLAIAENLDTNERKIFNDLTSFVEWAVNLKNATLIAHNGKAYDAWMIHQHIIRSTGERPKKLILAGNKIMSMTIKSVRFIDSINHFASSLEGLPKMFGIKELKKGYYPYSFNTEANQGYVGSIPDIEYYEPDRMKCEKKKDFEKWYEAQDKNALWDLQKETLEYCISDVVLLKEALNVYRTNAMQFNNGLDPLLHPTIASYCMKVYRVNHLKDSKTVGVLTQKEYDFIRRSFFGGRTEVFTCYKKWDRKDDPKKYGRYLDFQSLYPYVQYYKDMPVGLPTWSDTFDFENDFGFVEVDIECPKDLYLPVLPEKKQGKLVFDLEDKIKAVYTSIELNEAVEMGYKITKVYQALKFEKDNNIFKSYVGGLLQKKVEATGSDHLSDDDLAVFLEEHKKRFNLDIKKEDLIKNPGMRALMKIQLNSLWGKFGQRNDLEASEYFTSDNIANYWRKLKQHQDKTITITNVKVIDSETKYITYKNLEEANTSLPTTSLAIASMTTSHARLHLYSVLKTLKDRALYCDTDSIIYEHREGEFNPEEGKYLGELECETGGKPIDEFVAIAPKSYSYRYDGNEECKFKGFTLNYENKKKINFDGIKNLLDTGANLETRNLDFVKRNGSIFTKTSNKVAQFKFDKRIKEENNYQTFPFGFNGGSL